MSDAAVSPADYQLPRTSSGRGAKISGQLVYAVGDIHGRYDLLQPLLVRITDDYARRADGRRPILVFCGDYVDRGPDSARVLEAMVWLRKRPEIDVHLLKGNHEQALRAFIDDPQGGASWIEFGGAATLVSYGVNPPKFEEGQNGFARARDDLIERMPASHLCLLDELSLLVVIGDYVFVHAGLRPGRPLAQQTEDDLLWIRSGFLDARRPFEKVVVHGHTWLDDKPQLLAHRVGLDTGSYATGVLTAARIEDDRIDILQSRGSGAPSGG